MRNPHVRRAIGLPTLAEMRKISEEVAGANKVRALLHTQLVLLPLRGARGSKEGGGGECESVCGGVGGERGSEAQRVCAPVCLGLNNKTTQAVDAPSPTP